MSSLYSILLCGVACSQLVAQTAQPQTKIPIHKENVIVTGEWQPIALEEADRSVNQYHLVAPALLFGNVTDVLSLDSSVFVRPRGATGIQADISIRGGSFEQTLVLLNGMRLNDVQ